MAETTVAAGLTVEQWNDNFFQEYVRENRFKRYMGTSENSIIQLNEDLSVKPGNKVHMPLITRLKGAGVSGSAVLEGNEEALSNHEFGITIDTYRHAVLVTDHEQQKTGIQLRSAAKSGLKTWAMERLRNAVITAFGSINDVAYGTATSGQRNAWLTANADRILYGAAKANMVAGDHAASLLNIDGTNDKLSADLISLLRRIAQNADPHIRPVTVGEDEETYVCFVGSLAFRDLKKSMQTFHKDSMERGKSNPLYRDGDLVWDGVVVREVPEIPVIAGAGAAGINVGPVYFCGAQAIGHAWAQRPKSTVNNTDYDFRKGVGIQEMSGTSKVVFNGKDHGIVSAFVAAVADA